MAKRAFDLTVAVVGLALLAPLLAVLGLLVKLESPGPVFHRGWRTGRGGREFRVFRLRTMVRGAHRHGPLVTTLHDPRITPLGRRLRAWRLDELPQLLNVVRGDMSLVGPLPEDPSYVALYTEEQREVLTVRPGMTGPAALAFSDEERLLALGEGGAEYLRSILPVKLDLDRAYVARHTLWGDLALLAATVAQVVPRPLGPRSRWLAAAARMIPAPQPTRTRTLVYGAGETGQLVAWRLVSGRHGAHRLIGFLDDDPAKRGMRIHGAAVLGGRSSLVDLAERLRADLIVIAVPRRGGALADIVTLAQQTSARIELASGLLFDPAVPALPAPLVREVHAEDLLGRPPAELSAPAHRWLTGRSVLVTGACGSIGFELCRRLAAVGPRALHVLDNNESGLFDLEMELTARSPGLPLTTWVGDVTDDPKIDRLLAEVRPELVLHVAAYKHVALMERFPEEAVRVNLLGTGIVLSRARQHGAGRFVLISSDKAVHPTSVMGMTKRVAEMMTLARPPAGAAPGTLCTAVRFGNVLGSRGSVVPTFARQIELGGPVTITHPEMTRFFMDLSEAANLILEAAAMTRGGEIFMLEMGERIRIVDIASRMIRLRGLRPDLDVGLAYIGVRPGEKLHEELLHPHERPQPTEHPLIRAVLGAETPAWEEAQREVGLLTELAARGDRPALVRELRRIALAGPGPARHPLPGAAGAGS